MYDLVTDALDEDEEDEDDEPQEPSRPYKAGHCTDAQEGCRALDNRRKTRK